MKNKNFLKKLTAGILGFVMTLGVGAAGYAASATSAKATIDDTPASYSWSGYSSSTSVSVANISFTVGDFSLTAAKGTSQNNPQYYKNGDAVRVYSGNTITVTSSTKYIGKIAFTAGSGTVVGATVGTGGGTFTNGVWTTATDVEDVDEVVLNVNAGTRFRSVDIYAITSGAAVNVTGVTVSPSTASIDTGATTSLTATIAPSNATNKKVTWSSDSTGVATVNNSGVVTGVSAGTATITATTDDGNFTSSCTVTVSAVVVPTASIVFNTGTDTYGNTSSQITSSVNMATIGTQTPAGYFGTKVGSGSTAYYSSKGGIGGIRVGKGTGGGSVSFNLATEIENATKVSVTAFQCKDSDSNTLSVSESSDSAVTPHATTATKYDFALDGNLSSITLETSSQVWVSRIDLYTGTITKHTVTYNLGGGSGTVPTQADVAEGKTFTLASGSGLSKTGNTFNGWSDGSTTYQPGANYTMGTSNVTLTAQWSINSYTLAYNANGGEGTVTGGTYEYNSEVTLSSSTFTMEGYTQDGWSNSSGLNNTKDYAGDGSGKLTMPASSKTVYAHWEANEYTITYNANGGEGTVSSQTADYKSSVTLASSGFTMAHKDLDGWATSADGAVAYQLGASISMPLGGLQLYAHYSLQSHTVLYNGNGGEAEVESDTVSYGEYVNLNVNASYPGYTLQGWALTDGSQDEQEILTSYQMGDSDITLYAVWKEDEETYAFNAYANDGVTSEPYHIGDYRNGADITMPYFEDLHISRSGYTALGWSTTSTGEVEYDEGEAAKMGDSALNIYVVWQKHLDEKPTLTLSGSTSMWVGKNQTLTINYTSEAETLNVSASPADVVSLTQTGDTGSVRTYTVVAIAAGEVTITAGDSFYSDSVTITSSRDYLDKVIISGSLPSGTYYEGDTLSISTAITNLSISGKNKSGDSVTISKDNATWTFADGSSSVTLATGMTKVTVVAEYEDVESNELELPITVTANVMESLTVNYTGGQPVLGTTFSFAGSITANYSNGDSEAITDLNTVTIGSVNKFTLDEQTITVTHKTTGATGTFNVQYKAKQIETQVSWTRCTAATDLTAGGTFIIGYEATAKSGVLIPMMNSGSATTGKAGYMYSGGSDGGTDTITMSSVTATEDYEVVIGESSAVEGDIYIKIGDNYLGNTNTKNNCKLFEDESENTAFHVTVGDNDVFTLDITANKDASDNYKYLQYNSTSPRFAVYKSGQKNLVIYKKVETPIGQPSVIKIDASLKAGKTFSEGDSISASDFDVSALYDTGTTGDVTATSVSPTTLGPGDNTITVNYNSFSDTVVVNAEEIAHLDHITVVDGTGQRSFERLDDFDSSTLEVMAYYSNLDKTKFPDHKVTNFDVDPTEVDMDETGTYTVGVSYTENGVTRSTSYYITVTPKTSTYVTIEGDGIQGSGGSYTLTSPVQNTVDLTVDFDGDEELSVSTESSFLSYVNGQLIINSDTKTSATGSITFSAGSVSATLTVTVTAAETIQLISDAHVAGFIGEDLDVEIALGNVESATWTLPSTSDGFTVKTTSKDNTGFVGTISVSEECTDKEAVFTVVTGKGETLTVTVYVSAQVDAIDSISATCSKSYVAGQDSFDKSDLTVTYERLSGATGTLSSDEFTVTGAPTGKLARGSYELTITSKEGEKTCSCTISASMPTGLNVVTAHTEEIPGQPTTTWSLLNSKSQLSATEKIYLYQSSKGYVTGVSGSDATVSSNASQRIEFSVEIVDSNAGTFKLKSTSGSTSGDYISNIADNKFNIAASQSQAAVFQIDNNTEGLIYYTDSKSATRMLAVNGNYLRCYKTGNSSYSYFSAYISKTTPGTTTYVTTYTNHESMSGTMFDFINRWGGTELTAANWGDIFDSDEYKALTATDKEWFVNGVVSGTDPTAGYMESCEEFADFITKYDELVATQSLTNYLGRPLLETYTITIDYNNGQSNGSAKVIKGDDYTLPTAPSYEGYVFQGWTVGGSTKQAGDTISVTGNMTITANWAEGITFTNSAEFNFTGLTMNRFQYVFEGTCPDDAKKSGFLVSTTGDADLLRGLTDEQILAGNNEGVTEKNKADNKLVIGTSDGSKTVSVMFYYVDTNGNVVKSEVITMSFDSYVTADGFDPSIYEDKYAIAALQYYIAGLQAE